MNGKKIEAGSDGVATYKFLASEVGRHKVLVKINYWNADGENKTIEKNNLP